MRSAQEASVPILFAQTMLEEVWQNILHLIPASDSVSERLRRWTRNPLGSARRGSNPLAVVAHSFNDHQKVLLLALL